MSPAHLKTIYPINACTLTTQPHNRTPYRRIPPSQQQPHNRTPHTEVQRLSFVCPTSEVCCPYPLWNIQNLGAVPPWAIQRHYNRTGNLCDGHLLLTSTTRPQQQQYSSIELVTPNKRKARKQREPTKDRE